MPMEDTGSILASCHFSCPLPASSTSHFLSHSGLHHSLLLSIPLLSTPPFPLSSPLLVSSFLVPSPHLSSPLSCLLFSPSLIFTPLSLCPLLPLSSPLL